MMMLMVMITDDMSGPRHEVQSCSVSLGDGDRRSQNASRSLVDGGQIEIVLVGLKYLS